MNQDDDQRALRAWLDDDSVPEEIQEMVREAHGPYDYRIRVLVEATVKDHLERHGDSITAALERGLPEDVARVVATHVHAVDDV